MTIRLEFQFMSRIQPPSRSTSAFTLIELLVVISIIALLIGLLLPALSRARTSARTIDCGSRLRQIAILSEVYGLDNGGLFPPHRSTAWNRDDADWWWGTLLLDWDAESPEPTQEEKDERADLFRCPELRAGRNDFGVSWEWSFTAHDVGYGYNAFWLGFSPYDMSTSAWYDSWWGRRDGRDLKTRPTYQIANVVSPDRCVLVADSNPKTDGLWSLSLWFPFIEEAAEGVNIRHADQGNVLFVDGHYEAREHDEINQTIEHRGLWDPNRK